MNSPVSYFILICMGLLFDFLVPNKRIKTRGAGERSFAVCCFPRFSISASETDMFECRTWCKAQRQDLQQDLWASAPLSCRRVVAPIYIGSLLSARGLGRIEDLEEQVEDEQASRNRNMFFHRFDRLRLHGC